MTSHLEALYTSDTFLADRNIVAAHYALVRAHHAAVRELEALTHTKSGSLRVSVNHVACAEAQARIDAAEAARVAAQPEAAAAEARIAAAVEHASALDSLIDAYDDTVARLRRMIEEVESHRRSAVDRVLDPERSKYVDVVDEAASTIRALNFGVANMRTDLLIKYSARLRTV